MIEAMILIGRMHLTHFVSLFPSARTALGMWQAIAQKTTWRDQAEIMSCFPAVKFLTPRIACFYPVGINCVVTTQIAFNTGILIVLDVSEYESSQRQES